MHQTVVVMETFSEYFYEILFFHVLCRKSYAKRLKCVTLIKTLEM